jgi:ketosteroid isomerase-like protein
VSQADVALVREGFSAASTGDPRAAQHTFDPSIEWDMSGVSGWTEQQIYRGAEVIEFLRSWADSWREWHFELEEVRDAAGENVFVAIHERGVGAGSGVAVDQRRYLAVVVRAGRIVRARMFSDRRDALEATGGIAASAAASSSAPAGVAPAP